MGFDGVFAHEQAVGDLGVGGPRHQVTHDLLLAGGQQRLLTLRLPAPLAVVVHQVAQQVARDPVLPLQHLADAEDQPVQRVLTKEEPAGMGPHQQQLFVGAGRGIEQHGTGLAKALADGIAPQLLLGRLEVVQIDQQQGFGCALCNVWQVIQLPHQQDGQTKLFTEVTLETGGLCVIFGDQHQEGVRRHQENFLAHSSRGFLARKSTNPPPGCSIKKVLDASVAPLKPSNFPANTIG